MQLNLLFQCIQIIHSFLENKMHLMVFLYSLAYALSKSMIEEWLGFIDFVIQVHDVLVLLPIEMQGVTIELKGGNVVMETNFGLTVTYNGLYNFVIELWNSYAGLVSGLSIQAKIYLK